MSDLTFRQLEYFIAAVDAGSVTAAAQRLHLSQSALSTALTDLERNLGVQLLVRGRRGVDLTGVGREVLTEARRLVSGVADLHNSAREAQESMSGSLVVGCYSTLSPLLLPPVVDAFSRDHPHVDLSFVEGSHDVLEEQLHSGVLDLALLYDYVFVQSSRSWNLTTQPILTSPPYVLLPQDHPLIRYRAVTLRQLSTEPLILFDLPPGGDYFLSLFTEAGLEPNVSHRTTSFELVRSLVARGLGYSILSQRTRTGTSYEGLPFETRALRGRHAGLSVQAVTLDGAQPTRRAQAFLRQCRLSWPAEIDATIQGGQ